ncbi:DUF1254 domain-containing protein [Streptomyces sp. B-S-A8]|uniref:DUF1254 domain-containing protein n=1 Tax=Streptomyces solicavernae TaxID=3043614 RepID=A0ABT6RPJ8_9ACTN|nr:DUF1254 domain-containing protein [Streptomyces sp. B-S-A8]MDI3386235.1 DUF1254 domain-containing protein [Streptomyces sp. B-S-A8]
MSNDTPRITQRATDTFTTAVEAYVWGYPLVLMDRTRRLLTHRDHRGSAPVNTLRHRSRLATPRDREIVKPNNDTLYSIAWLDLARGPQLLEVPDVEGRYYSFQFLDAYTNTWAYVGSRTTGARAGRHLVVGPGSDAEAPDGAAVLRSPTNTVWLLGRTLVDGEADVAAATDVMERYRLTPLRPGDRADERAGWSTGAVASPHTIGAAGLAFFDELGRALQADPPPAADAALLERFAAVGIGPGRSPSQDAPDGVTRIALEQAVTFGAALLEARDSVRGRERSDRTGSGTGTGTGTGWSYDLDIGAYGRNHLLRAIIARHGLGALTAEEAVYATTRRDAAARPLTGEHAYRLHFPADRLPPVSAFWSLTAYDEENFLVDNKLDRYAIGDRTPGLRYGPDGSLDLYVQHEAPEDGVSNWLPVPPGPFELTLRFYEPRTQMLRGEYVLPPVQRR